MEGLIELVLNNPFLLILILGGLFSLFGGKSAKNQQNQEEQSERQRPPQQTEQQQSRVERRERQAEQTSFPTPDFKKVEEARERLSDALSIDEQREEQMKRLYNQFGGNDQSNLTEEQAISAAKMEEVEVKHSPLENNKKFKSDFSESLSRKGLINSVVMAEVLGSPRARRPYESVIVKRRSK